MNLMLKRARRIATHIGEHAAPCVSEHECSAVSAFVKTDAGGTPLRDVLRPAKKAALRVCSWISPVFFLAAGSALSVGMDLAIRAVLDRLLPWLL